MSENKSSRSPVIYLIVVWMAIKVLIMLLMLPEDYMVPNNRIELLLWASSIAGLLSMRKWELPRDIHNMLHSEPERRDSNYYQIC